MTTPQAQRRAPKPLPPRDDIPGFADKTMLRELVKANGSFLTLAFWPMLLALGGAGILLFGAVSETLPRYQHCLKADSKYSSAFDMCMERMKWSYERSYGGPERQAKRKEQAVEKCQTRTAGKTATQYCLGRLSGWKSWGSGAAAALGAALFFGLLWLWGRARGAAFVRVLRDRSGDVVWVYGQQFRTRYGANRGTYVNLGLRSGSEVMIATANVSSEALILEIARLVPRATLGYSEEKRASFRRSPQSLLRG